MKHISCIAVLAALGATPAFAVVGTNTASVLAYHLIQQSPYVVSLGSEDVQGHDTAETANLVGSLGYATAYSNSSNGGTLSASAFSPLDLFEASARYSYDLLLNAPSSVTAKVKIAYSGTLSSFGSGTATAYISAGGDFETAPQIFRYETSDAVRNRSFKGTLTTTIKGGEAKAVNLFASAGVNLYGNLLAPAVGGGSAYFDPVVTIGGVPEPATWALLVIGFGAVGYAARRRGVTVAA